MNNGALHDKTPLFFELAFYCDLYTGSIQGMNKAI